MKKKLSIICTGILCAALTVPCLSVSGITVNRPGSHSSEKDEESEGEERSELETTITETETEEKGTSTSTVTEEVAEPADIVFVIDSTGSMGPYIENVATNLTTFSKYLEDKGVEVRMAAMEYRDITYDGKKSTKIHTVDGSPWHKTTSELVETLDIIKSDVSGGGDTPETVVDALGYVTDKESLKFSSAAHKFAIVLSDANYKENNTHGLTMESLISKLNEQNINTSVITQKGYFNTYKNLVGSGGMTADILSENFSDELIKLADVIFKTIEREVIDETVTAVKKVTVTSKGSNTIKIGNKATLQAVILPEDADYKKVSWVVEDEGIVSVSISKDTKTCTVTGEKAGTTTITAVSEDGGFTGSYEITVLGKKTIDEEEDEPDEPTDAIELSVNDMRVRPARKTIAKGKSFRIEVTADTDEELEPEELEEMLDNSIDSISYRSTKSSVASVNKSSGVVTARKKGTAIIKTSVDMADGSSKVFKTVVYVR